MSGADADAALSVRDSDAVWREPVGFIEMYDYDLSKIVRLQNLAGVDDIRLISTDHDGHHGVIILGRKTAEPIS